MFDAFFKRDLAKRLLLGRSISADTEKTILTKLKLGKWTGGEKTGARTSISFSIACTKSVGHPLLASRKEC
jgi:hypothetical protein